MIKKWIKSKPIIMNFVLRLLEIPLMMKAFIARVALGISPYLHHKIAHRFNTPYGERIDIKKPQLLNEKIEWLKYFKYNDSPLVAMCYDKLAVREYVRAKGLEHILIPLLGAWEKIRDIDWDIPGNCVYKTTNGWSNHVFHFAGEVHDVRDDVRTLKRANRRRKLFWLYGGKFSCVRKNRFICEQYISDDTSNYPIDYKFYCFNGKPIYVLCCANRKKGSKFAFLDMSWKIRCDLRNDSEDTPPICPSNFNEMQDYAQRLSQDFAFVRVDLYCENDRIYFGELTFAPSSAYELRRHHGQYGMEEMGKLLDLNHADVNDAFFRDNRPQATTTQ